MVHHEPNVFHRLESQFHVQSSGMRSVWEFLEPQNPGGLVREVCSSKSRSRPISFGSFQGQNCWLKEYGIKIRTIQKEVDSSNLSISRLKGKKIAVSKKIIESGRGNWPPCHPWTAAFALFKNQ